MADVHYQTSDTAQARRERRSLRAAAARAEIADRDRRTRRADDIFTPGDFDTRRRPAKVHAGDGHPVRWAPAQGRFTQDMVATVRAHPLGWIALGSLGVFIAFLILLQGVEAYRPGTFG